MGKIKNVLITGITGNQGGAVARHLINENVKLFGLTRNTTSAKAKELAEMGVKVLEGDLDDLSSYKSHLENIETVFFVQALEQGSENEIKQGKMFIKEVKKQNIKHLVYSSVMCADLNTGVPHFDSKNELEKYIAQNEITFTILRPASFNENFLNPEITKRILKGKLVMPLNKNVIQQYIATDDIGKIAAQVINNPVTYENKTISIATDEKSLVEVANIFSEVLKKKITYQKLPGIITWLVMGKDLRKMFTYMNKNNFKAVKDIDALKKEFNNLGNLNQWVANKFKNSI
jgi:uncharacterized protein YbjT (DUF2867 family)